MIDPASSASEIWRDLLERLRREGSLRRLLGDDSAACLVTATGDVVLATGSLREHVAAGWSDATRRRLQALAAGLAPRAGLRLERVTFGDGPRAVSRTMATRRVQGPDGQPVLLLVDVSTPRAQPVVAQSQPSPSAQAGTVGLADSGASATIAVAAVPAEAGQPDEPTDGLAPAAAASVPPESALPPRLRVLYESDADGRIRRLGAELPRLLGHPAEAFEGQRWSDLIGHLVADPVSQAPTDAGASALSAAVVADHTFANQPALWRLADGDEAFAGQVSGLPIRDSGQRFLGHRGFILVDTTARVAFPARGKPDGERSDRGSGNPPSPAATPPQGRRHPEPDPVRDNQTGNVVPLRQTASRAEHEAAVAATGRGIDTGRDVQPPASAPAASAAAAHPADAPREAPLRAASPALMLSLNERNAFREIARALGARLEDDGEADTGPAAGPARTREAAEPDSAAHEATATQPVRRQTAPEPPSTAPPSLQPPRQQASPEPASQTPTPGEDGTPPTMTAGTVPPQPAPSADKDGQPAATVPLTVSAQAGHAGTVRDAVGLRSPGDDDGGTAAIGQGEATDRGDNVIRLTPAGRPDPFQELVDRLPIGVLVMREGRALFANRTLLDLVGHEDVAGINAAGLDRLFAGGVAAGGAVSLRTRHGEIEPVDARMSGITFADKPATLVAFRRALETVDAARLEAAKLDAARAEQQARELAAILDTATDGVLTLDEQGRLLSLNRSAEALFGYDQREVIGEAFTLLLAPESHLTALDYLEGLKGGGVASLLNDGREVIGRVRQGGRIPLSMTMGRVADGPERKFSAVLRDMTAWKRAETDLVEARRMAERASNQKSEVLAKISHEIRTPLNAIIGFTEVMSEERFGPIGNDRYKEYLQDIHQSGAYLISLVNDLLDLAKIEAGRMEMNFAAVNLNELVQQAVSLMQPEASRQRVVLRTGLHPRLPPVVADERSLRQILLNLLSNAIKFTDPGGQVIISTKLGDRGELALSVRDTGIGMTEKELQQALEPFRQVSATRRGHGTGLGLPITKALVEANKGALAIASARNEGTLVEVTFPPQRVLAS